jgi:hypothetical protein
MLMLGCAPRSEPGAVEVDLPAASSRGLASFTPVSDGTRPSLGSETLAVGRALRAGDEKRFEALAADELEVEIDNACSEPPHPPSDRWTLRGADEARAWAAEARAMWAPACSEASPPPACRWPNPLSLAEPLRCEGGCCELVGGALHNTPILRRVCFERGRASRIEIQNGC